MSELFNVHYQDAQEKLDGKKAVLKIEVDGTEKIFTGDFRVHLNEADDLVNINIETGPLSPHELPGTIGYRLHLSQPHADSIIPITDPDSDVEFAIQLPFLSRHYIPSTENRPRVF